MIRRFIVDGRDHYTIEFRQESMGTISLHAKEYPPNRRGGTVHEHHLYSSGEICVTKGKEPRTVDRAKAIAMSWCEGWSEFQRTGIFPNGAKRVNVQS